MQKGGQTDKETHGQSNRQTDRQTMYWQQVLSITLQRCNSSVSAKKSDRIVCSNDSVDDSYKHQNAVC